MKHWRPLLVVATSIALTACGWSNEKYAHEAYLHAKEVPPIKVPQQLAKHAEITPLYEIPRIGKKAAKAGDEKVNLEPPRIVKM